MAHPDFTRDQYWLGKHAEAAFIDELEKISGVMSFFRKAKPVAEKLEGSFHGDVAKAVEEGNYSERYHEIMARAKTRGELPTTRKTRHWGETMYAF